MILDILKKYKTPDKWLGTRDTAAFEAEIVNEIAKNGASFSEFKKIFTFLHSTDMDDSATGLDYLITALNDIMKQSLEAEKVKAWSWIKDNCFKYDDRFLETILHAYADPEYQEEVFTLLDKVSKDEHIDNSCVLGFPDDHLELYKHSASYYKALYMKLIGDTNFENFLNQNLKSPDMKRMKMELLISGGDKAAAFELAKDEPDLVLDAAELIEGEDKEQFLFNCIADDRFSNTCQKKSWWEELCKLAGDKYIPNLLHSPKHCEMVNQRLYASKKYAELIERINTGWIYDNIWGRLDDNEPAKYAAVQCYKKLKSLYPERCAKIMIDYAVFMMNRNMNRKSYKISAQTIARAGKLSDECKSMATEKARQLIEQYPKRSAMIEELKAAGLLQSAD